MLSLSDAIAAVESAQTSLTAADQSKVAAQAKYDQALANKTLADNSDSNAISTFNGTLDDLVAAAQAAKIPPVSPTPPPSQSPIQV
jgi:hypothetical protein